MSKPRVLVLRAPGTNCDEESAFAFELAGGEAECFHVNRLLENESLLDQFQILCVPGGFSYGDDVAAGRILANQMMVRISDALHRFRDQGNLILGICNGFQVLIKSGLLVEKDNNEFPATLTWNDSGQYEDRWVHLKACESPCVFLNSREHYYLPIAHAEGRFAIRHDEVFHQLQVDEQVALCYSSSTNGQATTEQLCSADIEFPANPNGSEGNVAGLCDTTGRVFGLMPHPERFVHRTQHPHWTRLDESLKPDGLKIFQNAVGHFA